MRLIATYEAHQKGGLGRKQEHSEFTKSKKLMICESVMS